MVYARSGHLVAKPGQRDAVIEILLGLQLPGEELGCVSYLVGTDPEQPDTIFVSELWQSREQHAASLKLPAVMMSIMKAMPMLTGEMSGEGFDVVGSPLRY